ncbi:MAG TPA: 4Fe-4S dicluster domain-containing protein [Candidatus Methylomirabilis sp.]|nr:4Fe-4S dicluster domain-containing protein [Candidatus Methylomirabilis sp.]
MKGAILFDSTKCIGCEACSAACKEKNQLPAEIDPKLTAYTWTVVEQRNKAFVRRMCMHCESPTCVSVCPVGAFQKQPNGPVVYDSSRCIGCRYCIMACPFDVPKYQWDRTVPIVQKCTMCPDRLQAGQAPACASVCPTGATTFGDRDRMIGEARARLQAAPKTYIPKVYGLEEAGGTSVLMLSSVPFPALGFRPDLPLAPLPMLTWRVLSRIPDLVVVGGAFLYGIWWITNRRTMVQETLAKEASKRG